MSRTTLGVLVLTAAAMIAVQAWLAGALFARTDDFIYRWTWLEALIYVPAAIAVLRDKGPADAASRRALVFILVVAALLRGMLLFSPPISTDLYRYIWDGRVQHAGINPYRYIPANAALATLRDAAIYPSINRVDTAPTIYPPVAQFVFYLVTSVVQSVTLMKAAMVALEALAVWAILGLMRRRGMPPTRVLLYAWHPLPIWEFAGSGHVDALYIACLFGGLLAAEARRPLLAGLALTGLLLTKFFPVVVGPALYRRWGWRLPLVFALATIACYLPYLSVGSKVFGFLGGYSDEEGLRDGSGVYLWLLLGHVVPLAEQWARAYLAVVALTLAALGLAVLLRRGERDASIMGAFVLALTATVLMSPHYAWYFCWLVPFLVFVPSPAVFWLTASVPLLEQIEWPDDFKLASIIYLPFVVMLALEIAVRVYRATRRQHGNRVGLAAG